MNKLAAIRQARYRLTEAQAIYLRILLNEAFARGYDHKLGLDPHHLERPICLPYRRRLTLAVFAGQSHTPKGAVRSSFDFPP